MATVCLPHVSVEFTSYGHQLASLRTSPIYQTQTVPILTSKITVGRVRIRETRRDKCPQAWRRKLETFASSNEAKETSSRSDSVNVTLTAQEASDNTSSSSSSPVLEETSAPQGQLRALVDNVVNPFGLGRKSRQLFDDVWRRLIELGQLSRPQPVVEDYESLVQGPNCEFTIPNAQFTKVLVVGATGRVGRIVVRKLLLRGYSVKVLVRKDDAETREKLPRAVEVVEADLGDLSSISRAKVVEGCQKVVFCAAARSNISLDRLRVEQKGVAYLAKSLLDANHELAQKRAGRSAKSKVTLAKFSKKGFQTGWRLKEGHTTKDEIDLRFDGGMDAELELPEGGKGIFSGYVYSRGGFVELTRRIHLPDGLSLDRFEGLVLRVCGDGKAYSLLLKTRAMKDASFYDTDVEEVGYNWKSAGESGEEEEEEEEEEEDEEGTEEFVTRFTTRLGFSTIRIPFTSFRPSDPTAPPLDPSLISSFAIRFENRKPRAPGMYPATPAPTAEDGAKKTATKGDPNTFRLEIDFIKAFPAGEETDFVLVSCSGAGLPEVDRERIIRAKLGGEAALKNSGLGYTVVRPGPLLEEPGGRKALVFDQGNRITQGISAADVADVCVKALHDPTARNKSFDICHEYADRSGLYELVAHLPDKSNNYLTPALALLEKNT